MVFHRDKERISERTRYLLLVVHMVPVVLAFFNSNLGRAQSQSKPVLEAASVKVARTADLPDDREDIQTSPGTLTMRRVSLKSCIQWAYRVNGFQISGPSWLASDRFDITAKVASPAKDDQLRLMLQTLLAERFKLVLHSDQKEQHVFVLTVSKGGPKFHESKRRSF